MRLAYSYIRFSSPDQKKGDSKRRQWEATELFCQKNNLILEKSRQFYDEGKSGFRGKHRTEGALGRFLKLVEQGRVPVGSVLIVEAFDRLSREDTLTAFNLFTSLLKAGVDVVTLVDGQWFSKDTINQNIGQLFISLGAVWHAHNYSTVLAVRVGNAWAQKQKLAREECKPMTKACPGWLRMSADRKCYEIVPERDKIVKLIFWLALRGWGYGRIAKLLNRHRDKVPVWGVGRNKTQAWHYSYIQKILFNRAVLGEFIPGSAQGASQKPTPDAVIGYYPRIIEDATFLRVKNRGPGPRGPRRDNAVSLFPGRLFDGHHPDYAMWFRDHGGFTKAGSRSYVVSDYRRAAPTEPAFTWRYPELEGLILNYLADLDWSALTSARNVELRKMRVDLEIADAEVADLGRQLKRLVDLAKMTGDVAEIGREISELTARRLVLQDRATGIRQLILAKKDFTTEDMAKLIRQLAATRENVEDRKTLREIIRSQVTRIELFSRTPEHALKSPAEVELSGTFRRLSETRCVRLVFRNDAERWIIDSGEGSAWGVQFDGSALPPHVEMVRDRGGKMLLDMTTNVKLPPVKANELKARQQAASAPPTDNPEAKFAVGARKVLTAKPLRDSRKRTLKNVKTKANPI